MNLNMGNRNLPAITKSSDAWKFGHFYTPNALGSLGYRSYNMTRPQTHYHTTIKLHHARRPSRSPTPKARRLSTRGSSSALKKAPSEDKLDQSLVTEMKELREQIRDQGQDHGMDDTLKKM